MDKDVATQEMTYRKRYLYKTMPDIIFETLMILSKYAEINIAWPQPCPIRPGLYIDVDWPTVTISISVNTSDISPTDLSLLDSLGIDISSKVLHLDLKKRL